VVLTDRRLPRYGRGRAGAAGQGGPSGPRGGGHGPAYGTIESAVEAMRLGAEDYLVKPLRGGRVAARDPPGHRVPGAESRRTGGPSGRNPRALSTFGNIVAASAGMRGVFDLLRSVVDLDTTVLIHGGDRGRQGAALRASIHFSGVRRDPTLRGGQLRGDPPPSCSSPSCSAPGAAPSPAPPSTGAATSRWPTAATLLLDEIGEMPLQPAEQASCARSRRRR